MPRAPLWGLLADDPESKPVLQRVARTMDAVASEIAGGDHESAARRFVEEIAFGPGAWEILPAEARAVFLRNAPTVLEEFQRDRDGLINIEAEALSRIGVPVLLTTGSDSPPMYTRVTDRLAELIPRVSRETIEGAAHVPQLTAPERFIEVTTRTLQQHAAGRRRH